jgi:predicted ATPase/class 3 adenylate cyclase
MSDRDDSLEHLPRGTVTLLFADVEGSTKLLHELGESYAGVRTRKREIVRAVIGPRGGHEVDWAGDGAFLSFHRARDAVEAAVELQRALAAEPWPPDTALRLRIGIHTGEPGLDEHGYVGADVHVAARICSAAHGGQIVVSRTTRDFFGNDSDELEFRPLGSHRLKDVPAAEQLFQVCAPGLPDAFPPLRTLGTATLPALHHRLVGRRQDLTSTLGLLSRPDVRLVTITGPGGAGKSRLALEIAGLTALDRPVHLVGLAPVSEPELVPGAIAAALGVRETATRPLATSIADALAGSGALLYLDNFEHLTAAAPYVGTLLDLTQDVDVLVTSRTPLRLSAEHVVPLRPLAVQDAATLFSELAAARGVVLHDDSLPAVREICRRLDGLPLAIELVAARLALLPPAQLLQALEGGLALDMEGPIDLPERQRTLRATIDWSYGLLSESQRELHQVLAVFVSGCTLDDARALAGDPQSFFGDLEALVAGSLVRSDVADGAVRLFMLETVREDALGRLAAAGELDALRSRHADLFVELAVSSEPELAGARQSEVLERLETELDNIRAALEWCLSAGRAEDALRATSALERFWRARGHVSEARRLLAAGLGAGADLPDDLRANALWSAAQQANAQHDWAAATPLLEEALGLFRASGRGREAVFALSDLGFVAFVQDDLDAAARLCEEALELARELGDGRAVSAALLNLGEVCSLQGRHGEALAHYDEAVDLRRQLGDPLLIADAMHNLGVAALRSGDYRRARAAVGEALDGARDLGEAMHIAAAQFVLAEIDLLEDSPDSADRAIRESLEVYTELENDSSRAGCLVILAAVAAARGAHEESARLVGAANAVRGGARLDRHERSVLDRLVPELEGALGERVAGLEAEGARIGVDELVREVVSPGIEE